MWPGKKIRLIEGGLRPALTLSVSAAFVWWILMAMLVAMRDNTTGTDGSWRFGVTAGEVKDAHIQQFTARGASRSASPLSPLTFLISASGSGPLAVKYSLI